MAEEHSVVYIYHIFFIHSSVDGHLGWVHVSAIVYSATRNIGVHVSFQITVLSGYMPRSGIAGSYGNPIFVFFEEPPYCFLGFPGGLDDKESACNAGDPSSTSGSGRSSGEGNGYPLQYSCLENSMDRGAWWAMGCKELDTTE